MHTHTQRIKRTRPLPGAGDKRYKPELIGLLCTREHRRQTNVNKDPKDHVTTVTIKLRKG